MSRFVIVEGHQIVDLIVAVEFDFLAVFVLGDDEDGPVLIDVEEPQALAALG